MPFAGISTFSLAAVGFYAIVSLACVTAGTMAVRYQQPSTHWRVWAAVACAFALFAVLRLTMLEEIVRDMLREALRLDGSYDERRTFQRPLAFGLVLLFGAGFAWALLRQLEAARKGRRLLLVVAGAGPTIMVMLLTLRILSLHQIDVLLYGPTKLNWIVDTGASLLVLGAAVVYMRTMRRRFWSRRAGPARQ